MRRIALVLGLLAAIFAVGGLRSQTPEPLQSVYSTAALRALDLTAAPFGVERLSVSGVSGDAPPVKFMPDVNHVCSADDGGYCVSAHGSGFWLAQYSGPADVREWGAPTDGITDASSSINTCLSSYHSCHLPALVFFISSEIDLTGSSALIGDFANQSSRWGSEILCANLAINCIHTTGSGNVIKDIAIVGVSGTPVAGNRGLFSENTFSDLYENVISYNHDSCIWIFGGNNGGISTKIINPIVAHCATHYWAIDGYPALMVIGGRTGTSGGTDYTTPNEYIYATNSACTAGGCGANGIYFTSHVFNPGGIGGRSCFLSFANFTATPINIGDWKFTAIHVEQLVGGGAVICSDASNTVGVKNITFDNSDFIRGGSGDVLLFNVPGNEQVSNINMVGGCFAGGQINLAPSSAAWSLIYYLGGECPIDATISPSGSGTVLKSGITNTVIGTFTFQPTSSGRSNFTLAGPLEITSGLTADWSGEGTAQSSLTMNGIFSIVNSTFTGGTSPTVDGIASINGSNFANPVTLSGDWFAFNGVGNIITGGLTNTATGSVFLNDPRNGLFTAGAGAASKYVCVDANNKIVISAAAC